jgi:hypothetical protein
VYLIDGAYRTFVNLTFDTPPGLSTLIIKSSVAMAWFGLVSAWLGLVQTGVWPIC